MGFFRRPPAGKGSESAETLNNTISTTMKIYLMFILFSFQSKLGYVERIPIASLLYFHQYSPNLSGEVHALGAVPQGPRRIYQGPTEDHEE